MLPILPALILLILQGPTNVERLARDGRLPEALESISRQIETSPGPRTQSLRSAAKSVVLASLLTLGNDPELANALVHMLALPAPAEAPGPVVLENSEEDSGLPATPYPTPLLREGFAESQRSRDGPA